MTRRLVHLAIGVMLLAGMPGAEAQTSSSASTAWSSIAVPGGYGAMLSALSVSGTSDDWRAIPLAIELSFAGLDGLRYERGIQSYAALLRRLHQQATAVSADRTLNLAAAAQRRKQLDGLLETLGLEYERDRRSVRPRSDAESLERIAILQRAGLPMADLTTQLNAGATVSLATRDGSAPLPIDAQFWQSLFEPAPPLHDLLWAILSSREISSMYYALLGFDAPTLLAVRGDAKLTKMFVRHALVLPTIVPALRVREGRIVPPGGPEAAPLWEDLVGEPLERPADFVEKLLSKREGRLAYFYRTVDALPAATVRWALGSAAEAADARKDAFRRLDSAFESALGGWRPNALLERPAGGPAEVLFAVRMQPDGSLAGPPWRDFWRTAFDSDAWPEDPSREIGRIDAEHRLSAADLLTNVCPERCDQTRLGAFTLVQREFPSPSIDAAPALLAVVRSRTRFATLALELDRMRLGEAAPYAQLGSIAARIEGLDQPAQAITLVQFQAALVALSRLRAVGAPPASLQKQIAALAAMPVDKGGFEGKLVRWLTDLFPCRDGEDLDRAAARLLAGDGWQQPGPRFEWEGSTYRVDIAATEEARIRSTGEKFSAATLATAATFVRLADTIERAVTPEEQETFVSAVTTALGAAPDPGSVEWTGSSTSLRGFDDLAGEISAAFRKGSSDRRRVDRAKEALLRAADIAAADALASLVYTLALQDDDNPLAISRELPRRHHLWPDIPSRQRSSPWQLPGERSVDQGVRYISGSLLALDGGLPQLTARRSSASRPEQEPNMAALLAVGLQRSAALAAPWTVAAEDLAAVETARARGAAVVDAWRDAETVDRSLDAAGIVGPRAGWLRWSAARGEKGTALIRLEDLTRIGEWTPSSRRSWGAADWPEICLCLSMPRPGWEARGQPREPESAAVTMVEPSLRVAIELNRRQVPAALAPGVLMLLVTDLAEKASLPHQTDFAAIGTAVAGISPQQFDDYIAAVAARGPLVRAGENTGAQR